MTAQRKPDHAREAKLRTIGQSHTLPGMSQVRLNEILAKHGGAASWPGLPETTLDAIIEDIRAITEAQSVPQEVQP